MSKNDNQKKRIQQIFVKGKKDVAKMHLLNSEIKRLFEKRNNMAAYMVIMLEEKD